MGITGYLPKVIHADEKQMEVPENEESLQPKQLFAPSVNCTLKSSDAVFIEKLRYTKNYKLNPVVSHFMYFAFEISGNIFSLFLMHSEGKEWVKNSMQHTSGRNIRMIWKQVYNECFKDER